MKLTINIPDEAEGVVSEFHEEIGAAQDIEEFVSRVFVGEAVKHEAAKQAKALSDGYNNELRGKIEEINKANTERLGDWFNS